MSTSSTSSNPERARKRRISTSPQPSLEQKFELLEARFTQPLGVLGKSASNNNLSTSSFINHTENSNLSEHSFSFSGGSNSNNSRMMTIRSKKKDRNMTTLERVNLAAAKHMRKVAASSPQNEGHMGITTSNFSFSSGNSNNSQQTVVTGNRAHPQHALQQHQQQQVALSQQSEPPTQERVVAESPPVLISPAKASSTTKPSVARALPIGSAEKPQQPPSSNPGSSSKRKGVPKRKISSVNDNISPIKPMTQVLSSTTNITNKGIRSPKSSSHHSFLSEHSRDRSNSNHASSSNKKPRILLPPANNKRIHDFFSSSKKKPQQQQVAKANTATGGTQQNTSVGQANNSVSQNTSSEKNLSLGDSQNRKAKGSSTATNAAASSSALLAAKAATEEWQAKCNRLEQKLQDKDEQLKAVTGNKTILHTALQQALTKTRKELQTLQESAATKIEKVSSILEDTLRWKFGKQAKELRAKLSSDGNRLGRIVSTRVGMRVIDSWEEGYASRDWQDRKEEWKEKHRALLKKQERLKQRLAAQKEPASNTDGITSDKTDDSSSDTTIPESPMSPLDIQEAQESIQMHMEALLREEKELLLEEQALNDEKGAHIRALKRIASEDSSRFKSCAKLHDRYILDCLLGKGGFSEVWKGYDLIELREVAVKIHQLDPRWADSKKENYTKHVSREYEIHRNVRHSRIVSLYDVFEIDNNSFATVLECCKGTDLDTLLKRKKRLHERQARAILLQILSGMQYLSQPDASKSRQGIIHYDLKPGNILFDQFGDAKITDFGLSKIVDAPDSAESMELTSQGAGTYWYLPPECFVTGEQVRISNKVDVWSIGVIFYQMLYGQRPFGEGKSQDKLLADHTMLNAQDVYMPDKPKVSQAGKDFLKQCLTYDQAFRPTIAQLCENPYVLQKGI